MLDIITALQHTP